MRPALLLTVLPFATAVHHMQAYPRPLQPRQNNGGTTLKISNLCPNDIYPAILSQGGTGPSTQGFLLNSGSNRNLSVSTDWQGRVWGRSNCSFTSSGTRDPSSNLPNGMACSTGDCAGALDCKVTGQTPVTLAEFTLDGGQSQDFYDISMVDGYNLPMAILFDAPAGSNIDPSTTNPSCVGSAGNAALQNFDPYNTGSQTFLGTDSSNPLPFEIKNTVPQIGKWCPWDLQTNPPSAPGDGVYPYPDGNINRPLYNPCFSACAKYGSPSYCCTGQYDGSGKCSPNYYSKAAKSVCPDAYSYAYDDQDSTFITPTGGNYEVVFCPGGRSTTIISSK